MVKLELKLENFQIRIFEYSGKTSRLSRIWDLDILERSKCHFQDLQLVILLRKLHSQPTIVKYGRTAISVEFKKGEYKHLESRKRSQTL